MGSWYGFGEALSREENPLGLTLDGLEYDEERGLASLIVDDSDDDLDSDDEE